MIDKLIELDKDVFLFLNGFHSEFWDHIMWFISAKYSWIPLYLIILMFMIKKYRIRFYLPFVIIILLITASDQLSVHLFKEGVERLRPCHNPELAEWVHIVNNKCGGQYGFVSSHASNSFSLAMFTSLLFNNKWYSWFIMIWAGIVSYSRIYLGVHFPGDILGGALLGMGLAILFFLLFTFIYRKIYNIPGY